MAIEMEQNAISVSVRAAVNAINNVMAVPTRYFRYFLVANRTDSVLFSPQRQQPFVSL